MQKLNPNDPETMSADIVSENLTQLKALFPEAFVEGRVDFDVLKQLLGGAVDEREEKYGLNWHGKRKSRQLALTPSTGTLRPCPEDSVDWDTTQNLMIEGDNLEVLKLLEKSYGGKVKLVYIDPPYNQEADVVYQDDYRDSLKNYKMLTGQADSDGRTLTTASEASGRLHTSWLNMIYPRLRAACSLLRKDGLVFISISDTEQPRLRLVCDEVFGQENFVAQLIWMKGKEGGNDNDGFGLHHDYVLCYAKSHDDGVSTIVLDDKDTSRHILALGEPNRVRGITSIYKDGEPFQLINLSKQKDYRVEIPLNDGTSIEWDSYCPQTTVNDYIAKGKLFVGASGVPYVKSFLSDEAPGSKPSTLIGSEHGTTKAGGIAIRQIFGDGKVFKYPKPPALIQRIIKLGGDQSADNERPIVLDFFAGSGTTGHAVFAQNALDGKNRRFILVQLPEPIDPNIPEQRSAANLCDELGRPRNIAELTKERLRRSAERVRQESPLFTGDLGFRVFKLDTSNIAAWSSEPTDLESNLMAAVSNIQEDRTDADIMNELLLKLGLDLCVSIEQREISGKTVQSIGAGALLVCLAPKIDRTEVEPLALGIVEWHQELEPAGESSMVFLDSAFADDVSKTNMTAILGQHGLVKVRSL